MNWELLKALLAVSFGKGNHHALRFALIKLGLILAGALGTGLLMMAGIRNFSLPPGMPSWWILEVCGFGIYSISSLILLVLWSSAGHNRYGGLGRQPSVWPLSRFARWTAQLLPLGIVACIFYGFLLPISFGFSQAVGVPFLALQITIIFSLVASIGLARLPRIPLIAKGSYLVASIVGGSWLLERQIFSSRAAGIGVISLLTFALLSGLAGLYWSFVHVQSPTAEPALSMPRWRLGDKCIAAWFTVKIMRNRRMTLSFVFCALLIGSLATSLYVRHLAGMVSGWLLFAAVVTAAFSSDVRGISRRLKTPEIVALKGVQYFIVGQWFSTVGFCLVLGLPLLGIILSQSADRLPVLELYMGTQIFGATAGLLAGALFVPGDGEIGTQLITATLAISLVLLVPKLFHLGEQTIGQQFISWLLAATTGFAGMYIIETLRRHRYA